MVYLFADCHPWRRGSGGLQGWILGGGLGARPPEARYIQTVGCCQMLFNAGLLPSPSSISPTPTPKKFGSAQIQHDQIIWPNRLQLNAAKTEFMWCIPPRRRHQLPIGSLVIDALSVDPVTSVRDLGVHLDSGMSMDTHLSQLVSSCFGVLRQIRCICRSLPRSSLATLMGAFILGEGIDCCNVVLAGLPKRDLDRLQSVINAAARLTTGARRYGHVTLLLKDRLTLVACSLPERITYMLCVLLYNCLHGSAPRYLQEVIQPVAEVTHDVDYTVIIFIILLCWCR